MKVAIAGYKGSGKNYLGSKLTERLIGLDIAVSQYAYASKLKDIVCVRLGLTIDELEKYKRDEDKLFTDGDNVDCVRNHLTTIARELDAKHGKDYFINELDKKIKPIDDVSIITDLRLGLELESLMTEGAFIVIIDNNSIEVNKSYTEDVDLLKYLSCKYEDRVIFINDTRADFNQQLNTLVTMLVDRLK